MKKIIKLKRLNISDLQRILKSVKKNGYVIIRGLFEKKKNLKSLKKIKKKFRKNNDNSSLAGCQNKFFLTIKNYVLVLLL